MTGRMGRPGHHKEGEMKAFRTFQSRTDRSLVGFKVDSGDFGDLKKDIGTNSTTGHVVVKDDRYNQCILVPAHTQAAIMQHLCNLGWAHEN